MKKIKPKKESGAVVPSDITEKACVAEKKANDNNTFVKEMFKPSHAELIAELFGNSARALPISVEGRELGWQIMQQALEELQPQNALEVMLCSQIVALHSAGICYLGTAQRQKLRSHQDPDLNNAVKLLRLQHETIECLAKLRRGGEQKVTVQHIHINDNAQAAIMAGNFQSGEGGRNDKQQS